MPTINQLVKKGRKTFLPEYQPKTFPFVCVFLQFFGRITKMIENQIICMVYFNQGIKVDPTINK